jgi:hypothetical protein
MQLLPKLDSNPVKHEWWLPNPNRTECLAHFVKECLSTGSNIMEVLHSSGAKGSMASSIKGQQKKWRQYIESNQINVDELPEQARNLHMMSCNLHMSQPPNVTETSHLQKSPIMKVNVSKKRKINAVPVVKKKKEKEYGCKNHCPRKDVKESP